MAQVMIVLKVGVVQRDAAKIGEPTDIAVSKGLLKFPRCTDIEKQRNY
jgi:hypothetical protein